MLGRCVRVCGHNQDLVKCNIVNNKLRKLTSDSTSVATSSFTLIACNFRNLFSCGGIESEERMSSSKFQQNIGSTVQRKRKGGEKL